MKKPQQHIIQGRNGPPQDGDGAGTARHGDYLDVLGHGSYVNVGSLGRPVWVKRYTDSPTDGARNPWEWRKL